MGNDFILIDRHSDPTLDELGVDEIKLICNRRFGIGGDGLLIFDGEIHNADVRMIYYNADGNRAETCFNGIRCIALHAVLTGIIRRGLEFKIGTDTEIVDAVVSTDRDLVTVILAGPKFTPADIPLNSEIEVIDAELDFMDFKLTGSALSLGNSHFVVWRKTGNIEELNSEVLILGARVEHSPLFPKGTNFELATVVDDGTVCMAVWERGIGRTLACGSGATATVCSGVKSGRLQSDKSIKVHMTGGSLEVKVDERLERVVVTGDARYVFSGQVEVDNLMKVQENNKR